MNENVVSQLKKYGIEGDILNRFVDVAKTRALWSIDRVSVSGHADVEISAIGGGGRQRISVKKRLGNITIRAFDNFKMIHKEVIT